MSQQLAAHAVEFPGINFPGDQQSDLLIDDLLGLGQVSPGHQLHLHTKPAGIFAGVVGGAYRAGYFLSLHQPAVQSRTFAICQQARSQIQSWFCRIVALHRWIADKDSGHFKLRGHGHADRQLDRLRRQFPTGRQFGCGDIPQVFFDFGHGGFGLKPARNYQQRVVGVVPSTVVIEDAICLGGAHMRCLADYRVPIRTFRAK